MALQFIPNVVETAIQANYSDNEAAELQNAALDLEGMPGKIGIPQVEGGDIIPYDTVNGWDRSGVASGSGTIEYIEPTHDDQIAITIDAVELRRATADSGFNVVDSLASATFKKGAASVAGPSFAKLVDKIPRDNYLDLPLDSSNIFDSLAEIERLVFDGGYTGKNILTFVDPSVSAALTKANLAAGGAGNYHMLQPAPKEIERLTNLNKVDTESAPALKIVTDFDGWGPLKIKKAASSHLKTAYVRKQNGSGRYIGGYIPDPDGYAKIKALIIPENAAWAAAIYSVAQILVPADMYEDVKAQMDGLTQKTFYNVDFSKAVVQVNQQADALQINARLVYDADVLEVNANNCYAIVEMEVPEVEAADVTITAGTTGNKVEFNGYFNATLSDFTIASSATAKATVGTATLNKQTGVLTIPVTPVAAGDTNITVKLGTTTLSTVKVTVVSA